jgi:phosphoadenosine phosphosulfate reductase
MSQLDLYYDGLQQEDYQSINRRLADKDTLDVIKWAYKTFGDDLVYACSFGAEGMVLIDLISKVRKDASIIFLDTHFHFRETYQLIETIRNKYPQLQIDAMQPDLTVKEQAERYGDELWKHQPDQCCNMRKIVPLQRGLSKAKAWITGLRREQSPTRANTQYVNQDNKFKSIKICPLIHWTWDDVWMYIKLHELPYNTLHDQGYPSIGCEHCTLPVEGNQDPRAGRWAGSNKTECGLHQ